jgi:hypothetical protein
MDGLLLEQPKVTQAVKQFPSFYETQKFITVFTLDWSLYYPAEFSSHHPIIFQIHVNIILSLMPRPSV